MSTSHRRRLDALEGTVKPGTCRTCRGHPVRTAYVDPATDTEWLADMPASGCPDCNREPFIEYRIVIEPFDSPTAHAMP